MDEKELHRRSVAFTNCDASGLAEIHKYKGPEIWRWRVTEQCAEMDLFQ